MKKRGGVFLLMSICILLHACQQTGAGPQIWIDQPLDGATFPMQSVTLQAHASDSDGVASFVFQSGDEIIQEFIVDGSRMEKVIFNWMPPGIGEYKLSALAVDSNGNKSMPVSAAITITGGEAVSLLEAPYLISDVEIPQELIDEDQAPLPEASPITAIPKQDINCRGGPGLNYEVLTYLEKDIPSEIVGRLADSSWLYVLHPGSEISCWISTDVVAVSGDLMGVNIEMPPSQPAQGAEAAVPVQEPDVPEPQPDSDTSPPIITSVWASPEIIFQNGCSGEAQTSVLTVEAIDIGSIASVEAAWAVSGEIGQSALKFSGGNRYTVTMGPFTKTGTLSIFGSVIDGAGNWTPFDLTIQVRCCIC